MKYKKLTDLIQLIIVFIFSVIIMFELSLSTLKGIDAYSYISLFNHLNPYGKILLILSFIFLLCGIVMSLIQSIVIHKKKWFCFIKELIIIFSSIILGVLFISVKDFSKIHIVQNDYLPLMITTIILYPIILYVGDYLEAIIQAE